MDGQTNDRVLPQAGERYRNCKSGEYLVVLAIVSAPRNLIEGNSDYAIPPGVQHWLNYTVEGNIRSGDRVVLYQGNDGRVWGRSVGSFMALLLYGVIALCRP